MSIFNQFMKRYFFLVIPAVVYVSLTSFSPEKAPRHLRRLAQFQTSNPKNLRYLTFGTSRTYGSGIPSRMNAFPYLLSPEANNLAIRAAGPDFPALCTASMVGNERYDVIVLEYYLRAYNNLDVLAGRLRNRFPEATMVFVVTRMPFMFYYKPTHQSLKELLAKEGAKEGWDPHTAVEAVLAGTNQSDWMLTDPPELLAKVKEIADSVKGYVFELRVPEDNFEAIRWYAKMLYLHDQTHYTTYGHQVVYHGVKSVLDLTNANRSDALGAWDYQDNCDLWFQSGQSSLPHHPEMTLRSFSDHRKYALDITSNTTVGWIEISNPAPVNATLYVQYMATNPPAIYPKVKLFMESNDDFVIVDPIVESYRYAVHVTVLVKVSSNVQPGISRVYVEPLEQDKISPFRITGVIVTPAKNVTIAGQ